MLPRYLSLTHSLSHCYFLTNAILFSNYSNGNNVVFFVELFIKLKYFGRFYSLPYSLSLLPSPRRQHYQVIDLDSTFRLTLFTSYI